MSIKVLSPPQVEKAVSGVAVGDAYASAVGGAVQISLAGSLIKVEIKETGGKAIYYKILAGQSSEVLCSDMPIAANGSDYQVLQGPWEYVDVQLKNQVAGQAGTASVWITRG